MTHALVTVEKNTRNVVEKIAKFYKKENIWYNFPYEKENKANN
jgi:hypothetical protein